MIVGSALGMRAPAPGCPLGACGEKVGLQPFLTVAELVSQCIMDLSTLALCGPPPPPSPVAMTLAEATAEVLQELLLTREEVLTVWEKTRISEKALTMVSADVDVEQAKAEATRQEYLNKMVANTTCVKHSLGLDKMLGEKKVELNGKEWDLDLREAVLAEA
jgi:hypothetical protein